MHNSTCLMLSGYRRGWVGGGGGGKGGGRIEKCTEINSTGQNKIHVFKLVQQVCCIFKDILVKFGRFFPGDKDSKDRQLSFIL